MDPAIMRKSDREIRLLDLLPGEGDDAILCTTRVVSLNDHPEFETVSYVWGDRTGEETINVSRNPVQVTRNLHAGLLRLRNSTTKRTLWVDQICINQWDLEEKAAQVALMRDIYKQCQRCITWMGELSRDDIEVPIRDAEAVFDFLRKVAASATVPLTGLPILFQDSEEGLGARVAFGHFSMYGNPWWSRIWTVQEAIIPSSGVFIWGPLSISREAVLAAARNLRDLDSLPSLPEGFAVYRRAYTELLRRLLYPVHGFNHSKTDNALNLLMRWRHREFTDARDKVYALLGMISSDAIPCARYCDYTIAVPQLFAQVTRDLIRHESGLRPLLGACELPNMTGDVPSWAINFAQCNRIGKRQLKWWGHSHRYKAFQACGNYVLEIGSSSEYKILSLSGSYLDEVWDTAELLRVNAHDSIPVESLHGPLAAIFRLLEDYKHSGQSRIAYKDGFSWHSALCRTLVGDLIMDEIPIGRIESYGRSNLQAKFEDLFYETQILLGEKIELDYCSPAKSVDSTMAYPPSSPSYSPTSPVSLVEQHSDVSRSPAYSPGPAVSEEISHESSTYLSSQPSYTFERPFQRWALGRQNSKQDACDTSQNSTTSDTEYETFSDAHYSPGENALESKERTTEQNKGRAQGSRRNHEHALSEASGNFGDWRPSRRGRGLFKDLYESLIGMMENQTFFITKTGFIGIGPSQTRSGDKVWILNGGNTPFIMRKIDEEKEGCPQLALVGDAYLHGVMDGEAMANEPRIQTVHIH
ncbi:heterokaryon incompatibility protein [Stagonosporopsis vannaccii]|nr:heterokaryon incompatibility protein [Stagonosporopsis vannaccii]